MIPDSLKSASDSQSAGVLAELPRRQFIEASTGETSLTTMRIVSFKATRIHILLRLFRWLRMVLYFLFHTTLDILVRRDSPNRRAERLRRAFERNGGAFIKLGIHLSVRIDYMPWVYSNELSRMIDRMKPFPVKDAIATIERSTGKPLTATFSRFDPEPIISTSVACIYQALLQNGDKVIVKVRRPGVGEEFMADIKAFDWLLSIAEFLTIFRPGFTQEMRHEFRKLLLEELDFVQEARRQDAFRRAAARSRKKFFSAPRIHLELSGEEMVVNEFASGMWMRELILAVENGDEAFLAHAHEMNIDPETVAKRVLWVNFWSWEENLFFHADPNPDNIIIGRDGVLYFINFTTTGTLNRSKRQAMRQNLYYTWERDPLNMARSTLVLLEPLPPIDLIELTQELETYNWQLLYSLEATPQSLAWQERTSAIQWVGMVQLVRKYGIVVDIEVLRVIRATLLFESMAARLHPEIDFVEQYRKFENYRAEQARRRVTDSIKEQLDGKQNEQLTIRMDRIAHTVEGLFFRTTHMLALPSVNFSALMSKWSFVVYILFRFFAQSIGVTLIAGLFTGVYLYFGAQQTINANNFIQSVLTQPVYQAVILVLIFVNGRTVLMRMDDKEV